MILLSALITWRWESVKALELNALGDFFAGAFGPLAILWLVLGYLQQGDELKQNTEALRLQAAELANSVKQQQKLVELNRRDADARAVAARPKFETRVVSFRESASEGQKIHISLKNVGAPCSHLRANSITENVASYLDDAKAGSQDQVVVVHSTGPDQMETAGFLVSYIDSAGVPGSQRFDVNYYADEEIYSYQVGGEDDIRSWTQATSTKID
jgi:hypothetical protein